MPMRARRPCRKPGCRALTDDGWCAEHRPVRQSSTERGYDYQWQVFRKAYLDEHPICEALAGCTQPATEPHHVVRIVDGGPKYDQDNLQALCDDHHNSLGGKGGRA